MDTTQTTDQDAPLTFTVELLVHHGYYKETFTGTGWSILEAAKEAARQTTYASDLFDESSPYYATRERFREDLAVALVQGQEYRGYGWNTFKVVPTKPEVAATDSYTVELVSHYGDDKATFTGTGFTILEAAENAANQTGYASGLFNRNDFYYEDRAGVRSALEAALSEGRSYAGYGWNTFKLVDATVDQAAIPDPVDVAMESGDLPKLVSDELLEQLIEAHAVAVRKDSIRLFPESYNESTPLEPFRIEARRNLTKDLESVEYAYAALQLQQ